MSLLTAKAAIICDLLCDLGSPQASQGSQRWYRRAERGRLLRASEAGLTPEGFPASLRLLCLLWMLRGEAREPRAWGREWKQLPHPLSLAHHQGLVDGPTLGAESTGPDLSVAQDGPRASCFLLWKENFAHYSGFSQGRGV